MSPATPLIVAIDGPAGSGKTSTAREVARRLGYAYLDTGAMYRAVTLAAIENDTPLTDDAMRALLNRTRLDIAFGEEEIVVRLNGEDVSGRIREAEVGNRVSAVSAIAAVRSAMVETQRRIAGEQRAAGRGVVVDGRDIGTVVFPNAPLKIFMSADPQVRARRRHREMVARGDTTPLEHVHAQILTRDRLDSERSLSPLRRADDAIELDTSTMTMDEQVSFVVNKVKERQNMSDV